MKNQPIVELTEIDFSDKEELIKFEYLDINANYQVLYFLISDFEQWIEENDYLTISDEYFDLWKSEFTQTSKKISIDDFFQEDHFVDYKIRLTKEFFKERIIRL